MVSRTVALTFDDGPGPHTLQVLAILADLDVRGTFFVTGAHVQAHPQLAAQIVTQGHLLGNHTYTHPQDVRGSMPRGHFDELPASVQASQIDRTTEQILEATGVVPRYFRGPAGRHFSAVTERLADKRGLRVAHWTADSGDWNAPSLLSSAFQDSMLAVVAAAVTAGRAGEHQSLLLHDAKASAEPEEELSAFRGNTVAALPRIIDAFRSAGFAFTAPDGT